MLKREGESQGTISLSCRHNTGLAPRPLYALQRSTMAGKGVSWYSTTSREAVIYPGTMLYLPLLGVVRCDSWTKATEEEAGFNVSPASVIFHGGLNYFFLLSYRDHDPRSYQSTQFTSSFTSLNFSLSGSFFPSASSSVSYRWRRIVFRTNNNERNVRRLEVIRCKFALRRVARNTLPSMTNNRRNIRFLRVISCFIIHRVERKERFFSEE